MRLTPRIPALILALFITWPVAADDDFSAALVERTQPLLKAFSLLGTPYKFGGNSPEKGLDCSGFVKHVYKESVGLALPRTARDMSRTGQEIGAHELRPGDLVFFNTRKQPFSHVGIYAGDGRFLHASSRKHRQVTISRMDTSYWASRFNGARRVLSLE